MVARIALRCSVLVLICGTSLAAHGSDERANQNGTELLAAVDTSGAGYVAAAEGTSHGAAAAGEPAEARGPVEEIIVSARKRAETQMDVPISVTAFSQE